MAGESPARQDIFHPVYGLRDISDDVIVCAGQRRHSNDRSSGGLWCGRNKRVASSAERNISIRRGRGKEKDSMAKEDSVGQD